MSRKKQRQRRSDSAANARIEWPKPWMVALVGTWAALLLLSPPNSNNFWAVNGFRSVSFTLQIGLVAAAATLAWLSTRSLGAGAWGAVTAALAWAIAFPLREKIHLLGDIEIRWQAITAFSDRWTAMSLGELARGLHATPLDLALAFFGPVLLHRAGLELADSVSVASFVFAIVFMAGVWRLVARFDVPPAARVAVALALVLTGTLQVFAGYAESPGLLLALAPWWWAELLSPIDGRRQAIRIAIAWLVLILAHRMALVMALPMLWRAFGPTFEGDKAEGRRDLAVATGVAALVGMAAVRITMGARQVGTDFSDVFALLRGSGGILGVGDAANLLVLVAPLAVLAVPLGVSVIKDWWRAPVAKLVLIAALPLVPLALVLPRGPHGLGAHRDWDLAVLCGWTLTLLAVSLLTRLTPSLLRGALVVTIPVLALGAGQWLAANAHEPTSESRARTLADGTADLAPAHLGALLVYLGQRAADRNEPTIAAPYFERAYEASPNPRFLLLAAEAHYVAGNFAAAQNDIDRARASGGLNERGQQSAQALEQMIRQDVMRSRGRR